MADAEAKPAFPVSMRIGSAEVPVEMVPVDAWDQFRSRVIFDPQGGMSVEVSINDEPWRAPKGWPAHG